MQIKTFKSLQELAYIKRRRKSRTFDQQESISSNRNSRRRHKNSKNEDK